MIHIFIIVISLLKLTLSTDVCPNECTCSANLATVNCDSKGWTSLTDRDFPRSVKTLTLINNKLQFNTIDDRSKIEQLNSLDTLNLDENPLVFIPPFNNSKIRSLFLDGTSLTSAAFPSSYANSFLQKISLSNNKLHSIRVDDFTVLKNSNLKTLEINNANLITIEQNAFTPLIILQSLSLKNNQLKSCEFLSSLRLLSSIKLDGNQFTSLPQELSAPNNIKTYFFTNNFISVIDETSPLNIWLKSNHTNIKIHLANNTIDCCQSIWFIRFLKNHSHFIADSELLKCSKPSVYSGQQLLKIDPDKMNCNGTSPSDSWWTPGRIASVTCGGLFTVIIVTFGIVIFIRRAKIQSGYTEIDGINDPLPTAPLLPSDMQFPVYGEDDDNISSYSTAVTRHTTGSVAPTNDNSQI